MDVEVETVSVEVAVAGMNAAMVRTVIAKTSADAKAEKSAKNVTAARSMTAAEKTIRARMDVMTKKAHGQPKSEVAAMPR